MEESRRDHLLQPLLSPPSAASLPLDDDDNLKLISSNSAIIFRLILVAFVGLVSIWANHEASKGFAITLLNESPNTMVGARFQLFYASNEEATRMVIKASNTIEKFLFPNSDDFLKKPIHGVTLKLAGRNLTDDVIVEMGSDEAQFVLSISPTVMGGANFRDDVALAIWRGVARIWLWDGEGNAPNNLINGIAQYLVNTLLDDSSTPVAAERIETATVCWDGSNARSVAEFLRRGERRRAGFVRRLNRAMKKGWSEEKLGGALGLLVKKCR